MKTINSLFKMCTLALALFATAQTGFSQLVSFVNNATPFDYTTATERNTLACTFSPGTYFAGMEGSCMHNAIAGISPTNWIKIKRYPFGSGRMYAARLEAVISAGSPTTIGVFIGCDPVTNTGGTEIGRATFGDPDGLNSWCIESIQEVFFNITEPATSQPIWFRQIGAGPTPYLYSFEAFIIYIHDDTTAPTTPTGLSATSISNTSFTLNWTASTDNFGVTRYEAYNGATLIGTSTGTGTTMTITGLTAGTTYNVLVKAKDEFGNVSKASAPLVVTTRYDVPVEIGMVGVSAGNKNQVVWNKPVTQGIDSFYIYKESNVSNVYTKIGSVPYDSLSVFIDTQSNPDVQSNKYKLSVYDKNGLESPQSTYHKTMHLSINKGMGNAWNLIWEGYEGFIVSTYNIYRGTTPTNLSLLGSTSGSSTQYNDVTAPAGNVYYQLEVVCPNSVTPARVPASNAPQKANAANNAVFATQETYTSSRSNIASNAISALSKNVTANLSIYPNPTTTFVTISVDNYTPDCTISIANCLGQRVYVSKLVSDRTTLDLSKYGAQGIYFVQITNRKGVVIANSKVVLN